MAEENSSQSSDGGRRWWLFCKTFPVNQVIFFSQVLLIYIVVIACVLNLSLSTANQSLWSSLLSGSVGYLLPSPKIRNKNVAILSHTSVEQQ